MSLQRQRPLIVAALLGIAIGYYAFDEPLRHMAAQQAVTRQQELTTEPEWRVAAARKAAQQQQQQQAPEDLQSGSK